MNKWTWNNELSCHLDGSFSSQIKDYFQNAYVSKALHFSRSVVFDSATPWTAAHQASLSITNSRSSLRLMSIESVMPSSHLILCCPLLLLPSVFPSIRVFFPVSQLFASSSQSIGASALASVLPMSIQGWFPLGLTGLISLLSKGLSRVLFSTTVWKHQFFGTQPSFWHLAFLNVSLTKQT